jgi:hypothetical protein
MPCALSAIGLIGLLALTALAVSGLHTLYRAQSPATAMRGFAETAANGCLSTHDGYLRARLRGAESLDIDWQDGELQCDGGPRPDGRGIRLTFAGPSLPGGHRLRFLFGIAGVPAAGEAQHLPANVTVIFEGEPRLYSTRGEDKCTIDELSLALIPAPVPGRRLRVTGRGFCVAPAAAADGGMGLLLSRFDFAGSVLYEGDSSQSDAHDATTPST